MGKELGEDEVKVNMMIYAFRMANHTPEEVAEAVLALEPGNKAYMVEIAKCIIAKEKVKR